MSSPSLVGRTAVADPRFRVRARRPPFLTTGWSYPPRTSRPTFYSPRPLPSSTGARATDPHHAVLGARRRPWQTSSHRRARLPPRPSAAPSLSPLPPVRPLPSSLSPARRRRTPCSGVLQPPGRHWAGLFAPCSSRARRRPSLAVWSSQPSGLWADFGTAVFRPVQLWWPLGQGPPA
jgi:hypothetical protein